MVVERGAPPRHLALVPVLAVERLVVRRPPGGGAASGAVGAPPPDLHVVVELALEVHRAPAAMNVRQRDEAVIPRVGAVACIRVCRRRRQTPRRKLF